MKIGHDVILGSRAAGSKAAVGHRPMAHRPTWGERQSPPQTGSANGARMAVAATRGPSFRWPVPAGGVEAASKFDSLLESPAW